RPAPTPSVRLLLFPRDAALVIKKRGVFWGVGCGSLRLWVGLRIAARVVEKPDRRRPQERTSRGCRPTVSPTRTPQRARTLTTTPPPPREHLLEPSFPRPRERTSRGCRATASPSRDQKEQQAPSPIGRAANRDSLTKPVSHAKTSGWFR
ncbi:hypothetical protein T484DRAFT_1914175, partial [Baffinella frigidus]